MKYLLNFATTDNDFYDIIVTADLSVFNGNLKAFINSTFFKNIMELLDNHEYVRVSNTKYLLVSIKVPLSRSELLEYFSCVENNNIRPKLYFNDDYNIYNDIHKHITNNNSEKIINILNENAIVYNSYISNSKYTDMLRIKHCVKYDENKQLYANFDVKKENVYGNEQIINYTNFMKKYSNGVLLFNDLSKKSDRYTVDEWTQLCNFSPEFKLISCAKNYGANIFKTTHEEYYIYIAVTNNYNSYIENGPSFYSRDYYQVKKRRCRENNTSLLFKIFITKYDNQRNMCRLIKSYGKKCIERCGNDVSNIKLIEQRYLRLNHIKKNVNGDTSEYYSERYVFPKNMIWNNIKFCEIEVYSQPSYPVNDKFNFQHKLVFY